MSMRLPGLAVILLLALAVPASGGDGLVALVTCAPSCPSDVGTYVSCDNGTITDNRSGLVWLADANCFGSLSWHEALEVVGGFSDLDCGQLDPEMCDCGLMDNSSPGEWRLPSMSELQAMIQTIAYIDPCKPSILADSGFNCWYEGCFEAGLCSIHGVESSSYWSSSTLVVDAQQAWVADLYHGGMTLLDKDGEAFLWPVRGGQ